MRLRATNSVSFTVLGLLGYISATCPVTYHRWLKFVPYLFSSALISASVLDWKVAWGGRQHPSPMLGCNIIFHSHSHHVEKSNRIGIALKCNTFRLTCKDFSVTGRAPTQ